MLARGGEGALPLTHAFLSKVNEADSLGGCHPRIKRRVGGEVYRRKVKDVGVMKDEECRLQELSRLVFFSGNDRR